MTRGGKREGAGRKPAEQPKKRIWASISQDVYEYLKDATTDTGKTIGEVIDFIIRDYETMMKNIQFKDYMKLIDIDSEVISEYLTTSHGRWVSDGFEGTDYEESPESDEKPE